MPRRGPLWNKRLACTICPIPETVCHHEMRDEHAALFDENTFRSRFTFLHLTLDDETTFAAYVS